MYDIAALLVSSALLVASLLVVPTAALVWQVDEKKGHPGTRG